MAKKYGELTVTIYLGLFREYLADRGFDLPPEEDLELEPNCETCECRIRLLDERFWLHKCSNRILMYWSRTTTGDVLTGLHFDQDLDANVRVSLHRNEENQLLATLPFIELYRLACDGESRIGFFESMRKGMERFDALEHQFRLRLERTFPNRDLYVPEDFEAGYGYRLDFVHMRYEPVLDV